MFFFLHYFNMGTFRWENLRRHWGFYLSQMAVKEGHLGKRDNTLRQITSYILWVSYMGDRMENREISGMKYSREKLRWYSSSKIVIKFLAESPIKSSWSFSKNSSARDMLAIVPTSLEVDRWEVIVWNYMKYCVPIYNSNDRVIVGDAWEAIERRNERLGGIFFCCWLRESHQRLFSISWWGLHSIFADLWVTVQKSSWCGHKTRSWRRFSGWRVLLQHSSSLQWISIQLWNLKYFYRTHPISICCWQWNWRDVS